MKCRNLISGLHILANNPIPESILHADIFSNMLQGVSKHLLKDQVYTLYLYLLNTIEHLSCLSMASTHITYQQTCQIRKALHLHIPNFKSVTRTYY